jgi:hypothetical protein
LGGEVELFEAILDWELTGTGDLAGFERSLQIPVLIETHTGPRTPNDPVQTFPTDLFQMQGQLPPGDPDFDVLQIVAGTSFGLPSPGQTTLTRRAGGSFSVDSFFDITYQIDFVGAPGSMLAGLSGSTTGTLRMAVEAPPEATSSCFVPDNGTVSADLPPIGCEYRSPTETMLIADGLPPGSAIVLRPVNHDFVCLLSPCGQPGGLLGGDEELFSSTLTFQLDGTGTLAGFNRHISMSATNETHSAPRMPGDPVQFFNTDTYQLVTGLAGDPDFDFLIIKAGTSYGLPSPGQTILTDQGDGTFHVDSFFDVHYEIEFRGAPGSILDGMTGTTLDRIAIAASALPLFEDGFETGNTSRWDTTWP